MQTQTQVTVHVAALMLEEKHGNIPTVHIARTEKEVVQAVAAEWRMNCGEEQCTTIAELEDLMSQYADSDYDGIMYEVKTL